MADKDDHHDEHGHDDHSHDDHHGHLQLEYQPALPINNGKVILWLFLSTEIMFFAGLIGTYIVLRFGAPTGSWPAPHDVHLLEWVGGLNTTVLLFSSATIVFALEFARNNKAGLAKGCMAITLVLGSAFLIIKMFEYGSKFSHGIYPWKPHSSLYEKPDLYYVQAVKLKLDEEIANLEKENADPDPEAGEQTQEDNQADAAAAGRWSEADRQKYDFLVQCKRGIVDWSEDAAVQRQDRDVSRMPAQRV